MILWLLFLLVCVFNVVDVWQTYMILEMGGKEANPFLAWAIEAFGFWQAMFLIKGLLLLVLGILLKLQSIVVVSNNSSF